METIQGPIAQDMTHNPIYQVTLTSGLVVTNPAAFGKDENLYVTPPVIVTETGKVLTASKTSDNEKKAG